MEYEPGGVQDLQEALERLVPPDATRGRRLRPQHAQPRRQRALASAGVAGGSVALDPPRSREPRPRHLAAGRTDRFRRPAAGSRGPRPDRVLRVLDSDPLRKWQPPGPFRTSRGALYSAARSGSPRAAQQALSGEESPSPQGATVFENSTACAPDGRLRPIRLCASRFDPPPASVAGRPEKSKKYLQYPVEAPGLCSMCTSSPLCGAPTALREQFFTESLILAQDERWRRA